MNWGQPVENTSGLPRLFKNYLKLPDPKIFFLEEWRLYSFYLSFMFLKVSLVRFFFQDPVFVLLVNSSNSIYL